ncbi:MAG: ATP-binding protein [Eubacterium sp.]|nr:ATP-binding protein [Eubacterium sp.]
MEERKFDATKDNLIAVNMFIEEYLERYHCSMKDTMQIGIAVEEIFVNIANYAYGSGTGTATVGIDMDEETHEVSITFCDQGVPYDPLEKADPDVTLSAEERQIGGLGIFMTKKIMDQVSYEYKENCNILTLKKKIRMD